MRLISHKFSDTLTRMKGRRNAKRSNYRDFSSCDTGPALYAAVNCWRRIRRRDVKAFSGFARAADLSTRLEEYAGNHNLYSASV